MSTPNLRIELPPDLLPIPETTARAEFIQQLHTSIREFVPPDPLTNPFDAAIIDKDLATQLFPPPGTDYDRYSSLCRYISAGGKVDMLGIEVTQYSFKLKIDDLTGKVIVLGQLKIKAREDGKEGAVHVKFPCFEHISLIPPHHLRGNGAFEKRGEWLVCHDRVEKGDGETLDEFWQRCRSMPGKASWRIFNASGAGRPGFQDPSVFASVMEDILAVPKSPVAEI
jgi:hypothetical protein